MFFRIRQSHYCGVVGSHLELWACFIKREVDFILTGNLQNLSLAGVCPSQNTGGHIKGWRVNILLCGPPAIVLSQWNAGNQVNKSHNIYCV